MKSKTHCLLCTDCHIFNNLPLTGKPGEEAEISKLPAAIRSAYPGYMGPGNVFETNCAMVSLQEQVALSSVPMLELMSVQPRQVSVLLQQHVQ